MARVSDYIPLGPRLVLSRCCYFLSAVAVAGLVLGIQSQISRRSSKDSSTALSVEGRPVRTVGPVNAGAEVPLDFRVTNGGSTSVRITRQITSCGCVSISKAPKLIDPGETVDVRMVVDTSNKVGEVQIRAVWLGEDPDAPVAILTGHIRVIADEVDRHINLGELPQSSSVDRIVTVDGLSGKALATVEGGDGPIWELKPVKEFDGPRTTLRIVGRTPPVTMEMGSRDLLMRYSLLYQSEDARCVNLFVHGTVLADWIVPEEVFLTPPPVSAGNIGRKSFLITERKWNPVNASKFRRPTVALIDVSSPHISVALSPSLDRSVTVEMEYDLSKLHSSGEQLKLRLCGMNGVDEDVVVRVRPMVR